MRLLALALLPILAAAASLDGAALERDLQRISGAVDGRLGACVADTRTMACVRGQERFPMQSVMKLLVGIATLEAVDRGAWKLDEAVVIRRQDLSLYVQPLAGLVTGQGFRTTVGDLVRRAVIDSDSAATDVLIARLGGPAAVQSVLRKRGVAGIRIDRDERHLQTEIAGIEWKPEFVDAALLERAIAAVPDSSRSEAYARYQRDPRDTSTPAGMSSMLRMLAEGNLLSPASTAFLLQAMSDTATFPDRLRAGLAPGWKAAHKTGTSGSWQGVTAATNDVGILTAPDGTRLAVSVFVADAGAAAQARAAAIAAVAAAAVTRYRYDASGPTGATQGGGSPRPGRPAPSAAPGAPPLPPPSSRR